MAAQKLINQEISTSFTKTSQIQHKKQNLCAIYWWPIGQLSRKMHLGEYKNMKHVKYLIKATAN